MGSSRKAAQVEIKGLRVLITRDGEHWFAQGLEIDYSAYGATVDDVKDKFAEGLCRSLAANISAFGHTNNFVKIAPEEEWKRFLQGGAEEFRLSMVRDIELPDNLPDPGLPFDSIHFYEPKKAGRSREASRE